MPTPASCASAPTLIRYVRGTNQLVVNLRAWNARALVIRFADVLAVRDMLAGSFSDLLEDDGRSADLLDDALRASLEEIPTEHPYHTYAFLNHDDEPCLEVVAATCVVSPEPRAAA